MKVFVSLKKTEHVTLNVVSTYSYISFRDVQKNMMRTLACVATAMKILFFFFFYLWDTIVNEWLQDGDHITAASSRGKEKHKGSGLKIILKWWIWTFNRHEFKPKRKWKNILRVCRFPEAYSKSSHDEWSSPQEWSGCNFYFTDSGSQKNTFLSNWRPKKSACLMFDPLRQRHVVPPCCQPQERRFK